MGPASVGVNEMMFYLERDVCDGSAWSLKWGTLILYPGGLVFYYNRPRKEAPGRMQDVVKTPDIVEVSVEKMDLLVSKIFWVGRKEVLIKTNEGGKRYYLRETEKLLTGFRFVNPKINLVDRTKG